MASKSTMSIREVVAENIRFAREQASVSQAEVARALGLASHSAISDIELGRRRVSATELAQLSELLGKSTDWFFAPESSHEDFVALARAQVKPATVRKCLAEAERYFRNFLLLLKLLKRSPAR